MVIQRITRRQFLKVSAMAASGVVLAACGPTLTPTPVPTTKAPTAVPTAVPAAAPTFTPTPKPTATPVPKAGGKVVFGVTSLGPSFDPHITTGMRHTYPHLYDTLLHHADDGSIVPSLATEWKASADGLTWTFKLRDGVKFHDGTSFNAEAVKFNFERIIDPATQSVFSKNLVGTFQKATVIDPLTVQLQLSAPFPAFEVNLTRWAMGMVSPTAVRKFGADFLRNPVGTGPFVFKEWVEKDHLTLVKNPDYNWAPPSFKHQGPAYLDELRYVLIPEAGTRLTALETGEVNGIEYVPEVEWERIKNSPKYTTMISMLTGMAWSVFINVDRPITSDLKVRQALEYGFDRAGFIKAQLKNTLPPITGPFLPAVLCYDPTADNKYPYDPDKAKSLLDEAGWKVGADGIRQKDGQPLQLVWRDCTERGGVVFQAQMQRIGVKVTIQMSECPVRVQDVSAGKHDLTVQAPLSTDPDVVEQYFHSRNIGSWNWIRMRSSELDTLIDKGRSETNSAERCKIYSQIQHFMMDNALIIPVYAQGILDAFHANMTGMKVSRDGLSIYMYDVQLL